MVGLKRAGRGPRKPSSHQSAPQGTAAGSKRHDQIRGLILRSADKVEICAIKDLTVNARNARTHSDRQLAQIANSIKRFGFTNPVLVDDTGVILAGHGRVEAAKDLGLTAVPTLRISGMTEAEKRAYVIADNRIAELAGWDEDILAEELEFLSSPEIDLDVEITGFDTQTIDLVIGHENEQGRDLKADAVIEPNQGPAVAAVGDLWFLGRHRLLCGDARDPQAFERLMRGAIAQMVFTDPPYNVPIAGHAQGLGRIKHADFVMASGEMSEVAFERFLERVLGNCAAASADGSIHFVCMDWRHMREMLEAGSRAYSSFKNLCVWAKSNAGMGSFYRSQHELVFVFKNGNAAHINNFGLGDGGRYRTNLWRCPGVNTLKTGCDSELALHPTVKPVALVADAIKDCSRRGGIVLDPFVGSGTTIVAAEKTGRCAFAIELDPHYVDVAIRRFENLFGIEAHLEETGKTFAEAAARREAQRGEQAADAPAHAQTSRDPMPTKHQRHTT